MKAMRIQLEQPARVEIRTVEGVIVRELKAGTHTAKSAEDRRAFEELIAAGAAKRAKAIPKAKATAKAPQPQPAAEAAERSES